MAKYKYTNPEHTKVADLEMGVFGIHQGVHLWSEVQEYLNGGGTIEDFYTPPTLEEAALVAGMKVHEEKRKAKEEGVLADGILFDTDETARLSYIEFMLKLIQNPLYKVSNWKASERVWVTMDAILFNKLISAWEQKLISIFSFVKTKEEELLSKTSLEEINQVDTKYPGV